MESATSTKNLLEDNVNLNTIVPIASEGGERDPTPESNPPPPLPAPRDFKRFSQLGPLPHLLQWLLGLPLALAMVVVPLLLLQVPLVRGGYSLFSLTPPIRPLWWVEGLRATLLVGSAYLAHVLTALGLTAIVYVVYRLSRRFEEVSTEVRRMVDMVLSLQRWWALASAGSLLAIAAKILYPLPPNQLAQALAEGGGGAEVAVSPQLWTEAVLAYMTRSPQFFITRACYSVAAIIACVVLEKVILQQIAIHFRQTALGERIADNDFCLRVARRLRSDLAQRYGPAPCDEEGNPLTGPFLWEHLAKEGVIKASHLYALLPASEADRFFALLDEDDTGDLNQATFIRAIDRLYGDRESLDRSVIDQTRVIGQLDHILLGFFLFLGILASLAIMDVSLKMILSFLTATIGSMVFIFGGTIKQMSESIVFIIFTHPYDVDDRIMLNGVSYRVIEIGIWTTTLAGPGGRLTYINNNQIKGEGIVNLRRSPRMSEKIVVSVRPSVERSAIDRMDAMLAEWVREQRRDYLSYTMKGVQVVDREHMEIEFSLEHRSNFQDGGLKDRRTRQFMFKLKEVLTACGIGLSPSFTGGGTVS